MQKPGRNDSCTCGSGKKYRKCCGKSNIFAFNPTLYTSELDRLQQELMRFASQEYGDELVDLYEEYIELYVYEGQDNETVLSYLAMVLHWVIFREPVDHDQTIYEMFYQKEYRNIKNRTVKKAFSTWHNADPGVFEIVAVDERAGGMMTVKNLATDDKYPCIPGQNTEELIGKLVIGVLVPYVNAHAFFMATTEIPQENEMDVLDVMEDIMEIDEDVDALFPDFLADAMGLQEEYGEELE